MDCIIGQRPFDQGRLAIQQIYKILVLHECPADRLEIPFDIYMKENLL